QGLVDQERSWRTDPQGRERPDLAYRNGSGAGRRYGQPNGGGSGTPWHQEQQLRIRAGRGGPENRRLRLRPEEAAGEPGRPEEDRRLHAERASRRAGLQG